MSRGTPKSTKSNHNSVKHMQGSTWETYCPGDVHVNTALNPMMTYDFFQRRLVFNNDALRFLKSTKVRFTANRALCTFRVVPVYIVDIHAETISRQGCIDNTHGNAISLMRWMRMDTNNKTLIGSIAMLPCPGGYLEGSYADLVTRRAAALAEEVSAMEAENYAASPS